ncbi:MAG TPA: aminomethyltransferase family protein [Blastocatellia bacterium]|nr:aminomethyltransferase family protein [Blastocatellia bacterium]
MGDNPAPALKTSALYESQKQLGARFAEGLGGLTAASYGDLIQEYNAVRIAAGLLDLSAGGAIKIGGKEAIQFLNGLVTNNVKTLESGHGIRAAFLTGHGKVKALCRILGLGDEFLVLTDPQTHQKVLSYITPFTFAGDFRVEDVSVHHRPLSVQGPKALQVMKEVCFEPVPALGDHDWIETIIAGQSIIVLAASHTGDDGFDILVPEAGLEDVWDFLLMKGAFHSIKPCGSEALNILRIEAGIPIYGIDIDETNMMLETGLVDAVSYNKGCYTGQEAVAMATYRGHVSKKLCGLTIPADSKVASGDKISKPTKEIGYVTSVANSPALQTTIALGYVKYGHFDAGTDVEILTLAGPAPATIVDLPFYKRQ